VNVRYEADASDGENRRAAASDLLARKVLPSARPRMFHATIRSGSEEPLRLSGEVVPYDLQVLREHVLARRAQRTLVEVRLAPALRPAFLRALNDLGRRGVELVLRGWEDLA